MDERASFTTPEGRSLSYRRFGEGPLLVGLPGGPGMAAPYMTDLAGLGARFTVALLNPRGTGDSDAGPFGLEEWSDDVEALRRHLGVERMHLLGHSAGGFVAVTYAAARPDRVDGLVLVSSRARFTDALRRAYWAGAEARRGEPWFEDSIGALRSRQGREYATRAELAELYVREFRLYLGQENEHTSAALEAVVAEPPSAYALHAFNDDVAPTFDLRPELARIRARTLVIGGEADPPEPVASTELADHLPNVELHFLPGIGHFPFQEAPETFRHVVTAYLESL